MLYEYESLQHCLLLLSETSGPRLLQVLKDDRTRNIIWVELGTVTSDHRPANADHRQNLVARVYFYIMCM